MKSFLKLVVLVPLALIAVAFAVANRQTTTVSFDPFSTDMPAFALSGPLFLVLLIVVAAGVIFGGVGSWIGQGHYRKALRLANRDNDEMRAEVERLKAELAVLRSERSARGDAFPAIARPNAA